MTNAVQNVDQKNPVSTTVELLRSHSLPALPVAPAQDAREYPRVNKAEPKRSIWKHCPLDEKLQPTPLFTGKNPSYLDHAGKPHLVNHSRYQTKLPTHLELEAWFGNPANGVGTLGGWDSTVWLDFDVKQFESQSDCDRAVEALKEPHPEVRQTWSERTHSGGYRFALKVQQKPGFTNFALEPGGQHRGEALGEGRFTVLAPTIGPSGNSYITINQATPVEVASLESIGIYPTSKGKSNEAGPRPRPKRTSPSIPGAISLELLGTDETRDTLGGANPTGDRSEVLTKAIREWYGWENWGSDNNVLISGTTEDLANLAGDALGIDANRIERILKTIDPASCHPAAAYRGDEVSCWKKIYRLDKGTYDSKCPQFIKDALAQEWGSKQYSNKDRDGEQLHPANKWRSPSSHNYEIGDWRKLDAEYEFEEDIPDALRSPNFKAVAGKITVRDTKPDGSMGAKREVDGFKILEFRPLADFDFHVERVLESCAGGGLALRISRLRAGRLSTKRIIVSSTDCTSVKDFQDAVKKGLGTGVSCKLRPDDLQDLLHDRIEKYHLKGGRIYRLVDRVGQQVDGTWVFENCQFTKQGNLTTEDASGWVWNQRLGHEDFMPSPKIAEQDPLALKRLIHAQCEFFGSNFKPALITLGTVAAGIHYQEIVEKEGSFPILNLFGDPGSNKTIAAENALALVGWSKGGMLSRVTQSALYERLKLSGSLPNCLDDPERTPNLEELLKSLFNAKPRVVRGNSQEPHGAILVTSNHACGDHSPATLSRLIQLWFPVVTDGNKSAWQELQAAQQQASGALSSLIKLGYPAAEIRALEDELIEHLPYAHARVARSLALVTYYTLKVAELAGATEDIKQYVLDQLCPSANDADSTADSLTDFLDKLHSLQADALVGEWNTRKIKDDQGKVKSVAIHLSNVWSLVDKQFKPSYSQRVIKSLIEKAGGKTRSVQKFHKNKDESLTYYRTLLNPRTDKDGISIEPDEPEMVSRRCIEIPAHLANDFISAYEVSYHSVTTSYHQLPKNGNQQNPVTELIEVQPSNPVTTVTKFLKVGEEEEKKRSEASNKAAGDAPSKNRLVTPKVVTDGNRPKNSPETLTPYRLPFCKESGNQAVTSGNCGNWDAKEVPLTLGDRVTITAAGKYQGQAGSVLEHDPEDGSYRVGLDKGGEGWWKPEFLRAESTFQSSSDDPDLLEDL